MVIRPFDPARDEPSVRACFVALQDHEHDFAPTAPTGAALADEYVPFLIGRAKGPGGTLLVAEVDGAVVGFASVLVRSRDEPDDMDPVHAEIAELSVLPAHRGGGIGAALLAEAEAIARRAGASSMRIRVDARNEGAARLYGRLGFEVRVLQMHKAI